MSLQIFGISHKTAPIDVRERLAIGPEQLPLALRELTQLDDVDEALILSTCNRTELYCEAGHDAARHPLDWLVRFNRVDDDLVRAHSYTLSEMPAVRHALKVACGLDSMVLGEPQILGQLKQAYRVATGEGTAGRKLHRLFQFSFSVAKQVRTETAIGENPVSVAYAASKLAHQIHGDLKDKTALLIGAGETIELVANHLRAAGIQRMMIANRTFARARELGASVDGHAIAFEDIPKHLPVADIIVSSTASREPIISKSAVELALTARNQRSIFIVDLAVPRDVDTAAGDLEAVYLYSVDDLNHVVQENAKSRELAAKQAEAIIDVQAQNYLEWLQGDSAVRAINDIRAAADEVRSETLAQAQRRLAAGDDPEQVLDVLANRLVSRLLHRPLSELRAAGADGDDELIDHAQRLLGGEDHQE